jgi:hypothetical protein
MTAPETLFGPKILLEGPSGTGKTYAIGTLTDWAAARDISVRVLFVENGLEALQGYWVDAGKPIPPNLAWHSMAIKPLSLASLMSAADDVGKLSYEALTKKIDHNRGGNNAFHRILATCAEFPDDRTGTKMGAVDTWGADTVFVIDSLSELSNAAMKMVIGSKPTAAPPDYGVAQNNLMNFLRLITQGCRCIFAMTAHVDRDKDEVTGTTRVMTKSIGKALYGDIPPLFSDVIFTVREADKFYWDTAAYGVDTKTRSLGYRSKIEPNFALILDKWEARNKAGGAA